MATDPVCKMNVEPGSAAGSSRYEGKDYYFCSANCKIEFDQDPGRFVQQTDLLGRKKPK